MASLARPLRGERGGPEVDDEGNLVEAAFYGHGQVLLSCPCGCGTAWLEPADFYEAPVDPDDATRHGPRDMGETYWTAGYSVH